MDTKDLTMIRQLAEENIQLLTQAIDLVQQLSSEQFCYKDYVAQSSIGKHLRHILDFYAAFFHGLSAVQKQLREIDYDQRNRDPQLERDPRSFEYQAREFQARLSRLDSENSLPMSVQVNSCEGLSGKHSSAGSGIARELQFLLGHTIHHYAIINLVLRLQRIPVPEGFGTSYSTCLYQQSQAGGQNREATPPSGTAVLARDSAGAPVLWPLSMTVGKL